jgi:hypothetical protein
MTLTIADIVTTGRKIDKQKIEKVGRDYERIRERSRRARRRC